jgi:hypothetical protein
MVRIDNTDDKQNVTSKSTRTKLRQCQPRTFAASEDDPCFTAIGLLPPIGLEQIPGIA